MKFKKKNYFVYTPIIFKFLSLFNAFKEKKKKNCFIDDPIKEGDRGALSCFSCHA